MFRYLLVLAVCACIATSCGSNAAFVSDTAANRSVSSADATNVWNSVCAQYNFIPKPLDTRVTFFMGYYGSNFDVDFAGIKDTVNRIMGASAPTDGSDVMKTRIENWGQAGGGM